MNMSEAEMLKICNKVINNRDIIVEKWVNETLKVQKDNK